MDGITGVGGGGKWAGFVRPLTPEAHADERLGSLQVMVLDAWLQLHRRHLPAVHTINLRRTRRSKDAVVILVRILIRIQSEQEPVRKINEI